MEFGGREVSGISPDGRATHTVSDDEEYDDHKETTQDQEPDFNMRDIAIMHMAKKNLSFELEYIQIVSQSLSGINASDQFSEFSKQMNENPMLALAEESKAAVRFAEEGPKKLSKDEETKQSKLRNFL